jgi:hypothetical protein
MKDLKEKIIGKYGEGKSFTVSTKWVQENDSETYDSLHNMMEEFVDDESNRTYEEDLKNFEEGNWEVEYTFRGDIEDEEIEILVTAGRDGQHIANQPAWIQETVSLEELEENWEMETYLKMLA